MRGGKQMTDPNAHAELMRLINGFQISQAIHVAATLGIADHLLDGARTAGELADATGAHPRALYRLLRALAAVGVFREQADQRFALSPMGECLAANSGQSIGPWAAFIGRPYYWQAWGHLLHSVRTGENAFRDLHGTDVWDYRAHHPDETAIFDQAMTAVSRGIGDAVAAAWDFGRAHRVIDVGGGQGALLSAILRAHPGLQGILFDQPHVVIGADAVLRKAGVRERCEIVAGSFFEPLPEGADAAVLKSILHDWDDAAAVAILKNCRRALAPGGLLLAVEPIVGPPNEGPEAKFSDLNMLVSPGGEERTKAEFAALFAAAGFRLGEIFPAGARFNVIEGAAA
jgi:SAM-dependent methyltransferase